MKKDKIPDERFEITPHEQFGHLSDDAMTIFFQTHISICINSANLVWQRFSILLTANALIFGFLANKQTPTHYEVIFGTAFGLFLCFFWWMLVLAEWKYFTTWMSLLRRFSWPTLGETANPHVYILKNKVPFGKLAKPLTFGVIALFVFGYLFLCAHYFFYTKCRVLT